MTTNPKNSSATTSTPLTTESNSLTPSPSSPNDAPPLDAPSFDAEERETAGDDAEDGDEDDDDNVDDEDEDGDEDDDENDEDDAVEERESEAVVEAEMTAEQLIQRQKLADGFFEVEAIRKRRICKGVPQYLIKWRGWPESANTWEPVDHLQTCPDVVEAYEESLQSGQKKNSRKRKLKFTQQKKKMQYSYGATKSKISPVKLSLSNERQDSAALDNSNPDHPQPGMVDIVVEHAEAIKRSKAANKVDCNGSMNLSPTVANTEKDHPQSAQLSGQKVNSEKPVHVEGDVPPANELSKYTSIEAGQSNQRRGAQRRKSGSVRRFTPEDSSFGIDCLGTPLPFNADTSERVEKLMVGSSDASRKKKSDTSRSSYITKIVKPISYSASVTNNVQDVAVTFVALRSDGKEVMVDNKFLKATNPLLLINFYEQHLRYNLT
ncbi:hypothetical protein RND81_03G191100 [Saponaria officinalis]|uniref:Chromo domain-containing protein n=1 Tax=Saponaria officinalis TaxID=3572 RepID=A0AAW1M8C6_SAPOF